MQNKNLNLALMVVLFASNVMAQEVVPETETTEGVPVVTDGLSDFATDVSQKKAVDFPPQSSLDSLEMAPLPGIYETDISGPQPMAEAVSINSMPSERLLGRLTPEVFQEMAELERDVAYLELQKKKESMKNELENLRSNYRQARLDEIQKREDVVRSRIQWWQEQEKLRQELEKERAEAEDVKNQMAETEALKAQLEAERDKANENVEDDGEAGEEIGAPSSVAIQYSLMDVKGTRGNLVARVKNELTEEVVPVKVGDNLNGEVVTNITSDSVIIDRNGTEYIVRFPTT